MPLIEWSKDLSVNIIEIDVQHKKLVGIINNLHEAMKKGKAKDDLGRILDELVIYTKTHFRHEEAYFHRFDYPETFMHKKTHGDFEKKIAEYKTDFEKGRLMLSLEIMNFLKDWIKKHIQGIDRKYIDCFQKNGVK